MKHNLFKILSLIVITSHSLNAAYVQNDKIAVFAPQSQSWNLIDKILTKFNITHDKLGVIDCQAPKLHIVAGDINQCANLNLPKNYIFFNTALINDKLSQSEQALLTNAVAVWDISWDNINKYKHEVKNYFYLPSDDYAFLDPVLLPCFIPVDVLSSYRDLLTNSNALDTDISSHLPTLFCHVMMKKPQVILEAGVRGGDGSTIPLASAARLLDADLIGIDTDDTSKVYEKLQYNRASFVRMNDLNFPAYFKTKNFSSKYADFIFIDTSHEHVQTVQEIKAFSVILAPNGTLAFHDSNVTPLNNNTGYDRINRTKGSAHGNPRGVTSAIKTCFNIKFDEYNYVDMNFTYDGSNWNLLHYPYCNGLTLIQKLA